MKKMSMLVLSAVCLAAMALSGCSDGGSSNLGFLALSNGLRYSVTYRGNGNTGGSVPVDENSYAKGDVVTVAYNTGDLEKTGCSFAGWNTQEDGEGTNYTEGTGTFTMSGKNVVLYARWTNLPLYTVTFDTDDGSEVAQQEVVAGGKVTEPDPAPTKDGCALEGWYTEDTFENTWDFGTDTVSGDMTLYVRWTVLPRYSVTYDGNEESGGSAPVDTQTYIEGATVTVAYNTGDLEKMYYDFAGWNTQEDGEGTNYTEGTGTFTMPGRDVVLYANWTALPLYMVQFESDGGSEVSPQDVVEGYKATEPDPAPTKDDCAFGGWYQEDTLENAWDFATDTVTENMTLYAKWFTAPSAGTDITFSGITQSSVAVQWGAASDEWTAATGLEYRLVWSDDPADIDEIEEVEAITGSNLAMDWTADTLTRAVSGLEEGRTLYFSVLVRNEANMMALYPPAPVTTATWSYVYDSQVGESYATDGIVYNPTGICFDSSGNLYVSDRGNSRVQKFNSSGEFVMSFGSYGTANGQFRQPEGVHVDSSGSIYVVDRGSQRVQIFDSSGTYTAQLGVTGVAGTDNARLYNPYGVTTDSSGNIYVADYSNHRVQKFNSSRVYQATFGTTGTASSADGELNYPYGICFTPDGYLYVTEYGNRRVQKFDTDGNYVAKYGSAGTGDGQLLNPSGIAVDASGNMIIVDQNNHRIQKWDPTGVFIWKLGGTSSGSGDDQFDSPMSVALDSSGDIYVTDFYNHRIKKVSSGGVFQSHMGCATAGVLFDSPQGIALDASGNIYVADSGHNKIQKLDPSFNYIGEFGSKGSSAGLMNNPMDVAVDSSGNIFVADYMNYRVQKFNASFAYQNLLGLSGWAIGIEVDSNDSVYVSVGSRHVVRKLSNNLAAISIIGTDNTSGSEDGQFNYPHGVAVFDGSVYVVDTWNRRVQKFDSDHAFVLKWGSQGTGDGQFGSYPSGAAVDDLGCVYVADTANYRIQKFSPTGRFISSFGSSGAGDGEFNLPTNVVVNTDGSVLVADTNNHRIQKFTRE